MTVYADSLFLINFLSEYVLLLLTEKIASVRAKKFRKAAAALFGAAVSAASFCTEIPLPQSVIGVINAFLIVCIVYMKNTRAVMRAFPAFMLISFTYSGIISAISGILSDDAVIHSGITYININTVLFIFIFICTYPIVLLIARILKPLSKRIYKITVSRKGKTVFANALFDSGNLLADGKKGVIIAEWDIIKPLFDAEIFEDLYGLDGTKILPFGSLGGCTTALVFYADAITVENNTFADVPIGIVNRSISQKGNYNALIGKQYF